MVGVFFWSCLRNLEKESENGGKSCSDSLAANKREPRETTQSERGLRRPLEKSGITLTAWPEIWTL